MRASWSRTRPADARLGDPLPDLIWGLPGENRWIKGAAGASIKAGIRLFLRLAGARLEGDPGAAGRAIERSTGTPVVVRTHG